MKPILKATRIPLSDPDMTEEELAAVTSVIASPQISHGPLVEELEAAFAAYLGRKHSVAVASGTIGLLLALRAYGIGPGDEVVASPYSFRETTHAIALAGARPVFADIDYWAGTLVPEKAAAAVTAKTRAIVASNPNGHPAPWTELRQLATTKGLALIEDSTEAIGSTYKGALVGTFGDCALFDLSQPGSLTCGEGGIVVTDDSDIAGKLKALRGRQPLERGSVVLSAFAPYQAGVSSLTAALALAQLKRLDAILARRKRVEHWYFEYVKSFEGIKDPYIAPDVTEVNWFLYVVHLGQRFTRSARDQILDDLRTEAIDAHAYAQPLHTQAYYTELGYRRGAFLVTEKVADRGVVLPFHAHLTEEQVAFIAGTMKDASINVGAGTAIYL
jgi:perosamine synthetase